MASASHETAAGNVSTDIPVARAQAIVAEVLAMLRRRSHAAADTVFAVDERGCLIGGIALDALLQAPDAQPLGELVDREFPRVHEHEDQEHVAGAALAHQTLSVAVVAPDGRLIGAVPARSLLAILREEHVEDLHRLAGIQREAAIGREALEGPPTRRARHRLPWLLFGLAGSMAAAALVSRFERVLAENLAIAFFVPTIVYLADAIGTQTEAVVVRGLSLSRLTLRHLLAGELRTGLLIGAALAVLAFLAVLLAFGDGRLALALASAILAAGSVATTIGLVLPWLLQRTGRDPAFGSGPVATIVQDLTSLLIYLALAAAIVD
jgi:magnesium transporter